MYTREHEHSVGWNALKSMHHHHLHYLRVTQNVKNSKILIFFLILQTGKVERIFEMFQGKWNVFRPHHEHRESLKMLSKLVSGKFC